MQYITTNSTCEKNYLGRAHIVIVGGADAVVIVIVVVEVFVIFSTNTDFTATQPMHTQKNHVKKTFQNELLNTNTNIYFDVATVSAAAAIVTSKPK